MNRALIPALALFALVPLAGLAAPADDQKPAVQKPDTKRDQAAKNAAPCCSDQHDHQGGASGMPHDMQGGGHEHGGMAAHGDHDAMHGSMHADDGPQGGGHHHGM